MKQHAGSFVIESTRGGASMIAMINLERVAGSGANGSPYSEMNSAIWRARRRWDKPAQQAHSTRT
jgi:hypothetical protein